MAGRRVRHRAEALELLEAAERMGVSRAEWARRNGIDGRSLNAWRMNLDRGVGVDVVQPPAVRMVELVPATRVETTYRVRCGTFVVEVDGDFDDHVLGRLLSVVAAC
jgi:hypothetical protein